MWVPGLDASFSHIDRTTFAELYQQGYRAYCQCLWTGASSPLPAHNNLADALAEGFAISGYTNVNTLDADVAIDRARAAAGDMWSHLVALAVDMELPTTEERALEVLTLASIAKKRVCGYSARWAWERFFGSSQNPEFRRWPIWIADYDGNPDPDTALLFGPWERGDVCGKQYQGTTDILPGVQVDLNIFDADFWLPAKKGDDMLLIRPQGRDEVYEVSGGQLFHVPNPAVLWELIQQLGVEVKDVPSTSALLTLPVTFSSLPAELRGTP